MTGQARIDKNVGRALFRLRTERALTAAELARLADVSTAMISRIENGHVSPSLGTLQSLADALSVPIMALFSFSGMTSDLHFVRAGEGLASRRVAKDHSHDYMLLGKHSNPSGNFQSARISIKREEAGTLPRYQHEGYVFIYVTKGSAVYACGSEEFEIVVGDSLSFDAKLPHGIVKIHSPEIEFVTVSQRPD